MYNWNTNISNWDKKSDTFQIWKLEQLVNFGLNGEKINREALVKYWSKLTLDPQRKKFFELILWPNQF